MWRQTPARDSRAACSGGAAWIALMDDARSQPETPASDTAWRARQEEFVQGQMRRVFLIVYRIVGNVSDAQDVTQEAFIKALQRQDQLKDLDKAAHWLSRIATNAALDFLRRRGRARLTDFDEMIDPPRVAEERGPEALLLGAERHDRLNQALGRLTERERTALILRDVEDLPAEEVARRLNCGKATVRSHIANARVKLRRLLERQAS
jgi:RNA polymerase sigma-70 factor (ECF subfamily)